MRRAVSTDVTESEQVRFQFLLEKQETSRLAVTVSQVVDRSTVRVLCFCLRVDCVCLVQTTPSNPRSSSSGTIWDQRPLVSIACLVMSFHLLRSWAKLFSSCSPVLHQLTVSSIHSLRGLPPLFVPDQLTKEIRCVL